MLSVSSSIYEKIRSNDPQRSLSDLESLILYCRMVFKSVDPFKQ